MAEFVYTTSSSIPGPWLVDSAALESLDEIVNEHWNLLSVRTQERQRVEVDKQLETDIFVKAALADETQSPTKVDQLRNNRRKEIEARMSSLTSLYEFRETRSMSIQLAANKKVVVDSFDEALKQPSLIDEVPRGFDIDLRAGDIRCQVNLSNYNDLEIRVSPEHLPESRELFASLLRWANANKAPKWQQIWLKLNGLQWLILFLLALISLFFINDSETLSKRANKERARQLLSEGINRENEAKALEILLAFEAEHMPPNQPELPLFPWWIKLVLASAVVVSLLLAFTPKPVVGIGKGQERIGFWRTWMRVAFVVIPSIILLDIVLPVVSSSVLNR